MINKLLDCKQEEKDKIDNIRLSILPDSSVGAEVLSPFMVAKAYYSGRDLVRDRIDPYDYYAKNNNLFVHNTIITSNVVVDNRNVFEFNSDEELYDIWIKKLLSTKNKFDWNTEYYNEYFKKSSTSYVSEDPAALPIIINREANMISSRTKISPGNIFIMHPDTIKYINQSSSLVKEYHEKSIGEPDFIFNGCIGVYLDEKLPKDKIIVTLISDDLKENLFQIIGNKILFMVPNNWSSSSFYDASSIVTLE